MLRARILGLIAWVLLSAWKRTIRTRFENQEVLDRLTAEGKNFIYAFWHGRQFILFNHKPYGEVVIPVSESRDGEIQAQLLVRLGFQVVRGSSKRKGDRALLGLVDSLRRNKNVGLAVDGPRGPRYEVKQGITYLAGKLKKPIVPIMAGAKRYWVLEKAWDQLLIPKPFTEGLIIFGEPISVSSTDEGELEAKRKELETVLIGLMARADAYFNKEA